MVIKRKQFSAGHIVDTALKEIKNPKVVKDATRSLRSRTWTYDTFRIHGRDKTFSKNSIYVSQLDRTAGGDMVAYENGKKLVGEKSIDAQLDFRGRIRKLPPSKESNRWGEVKTKGKDIYILRYKDHEKSHEKSPSGRWVYHEQISNKHPKEAYRDFLRSEIDREKIGDVVITDPKFSNKEIKEGIRKAVKRRNIKTAGKVILAGSLISAGTIAGLKAVKKKKAKKEDK